MCGCFHHFSPSLLSRWMMVNDVVFNRHSLIAGPAGLPKRHIYTFSSCRFLLALFHRLFLFLYSHIYSYYSLHALTLMNTYPQYSGLNIMQAPQSALGHTAFRFLRLILFTIINLFDYIDITEISFSGMEEAFLALEGRARRMGLDLNFLLLGKRR